VLTVQPNPVFSTISHSGSEQHSAGSSRERQWLYFSVALGLQDGVVHEERDVLQFFVSSTGTGALLMHHNDLQSGGEGGRLSCDHVGTVFSCCMEVVCAPVCASKMVASVR
jgi:hypothetical protein